VLTSTGSVTKPSRRFALRHSGLADTGKGVPLELQDKVFEPFITSKTHGLGLGLAISRTILKAHSGSIWCKQNPGGGAIFAFSLPAAERKIAWAS